MFAEEGACQWGGRPALAAPAPASAVDLAPNPVQPAAGSLPCNLRHETYSRTAGMITNILLHTRTHKIQNSSPFMSLESQDQPEQNVCINESKNQISQTNLNGLRHVSVNTSCCAS